MKQKNIKLYSVAVLAVAFIAYLAFLSSQDNNQGTQASTSETETKATISKSQLRILVAKPSTESKSIRLNGRIAPKFETSLFTEVQGVMIENGFEFREGRTFKKGEHIVSLNKREAELQFKAQKSSFLSLLTGILPDLKSDFPDNYEAWNSYVIEFDIQNPVNPLPTTTTAKEKLFLSARGVYTQYYNLRAQEERLSKFIIKAPFDGLVIDQRAEVGTLISPGQLVGTIINNDVYELEAGLDIKNVNSLNVGDQLTFNSNEIGGTWTGTVTSKNGVINQNTQEVPVFFELKGKGLKPGLYLEGTYESDELTDIVKIPSNAIRRDNSVLILQEDIIKRLEITPVLSVNDSVLVKGLKTGEMVILNEFSSPVSGKKVGN